MKQTQIVLLGGGYTSVWAYKKIVARCKNEIQDGTIEITIVSPTNYHSFHGFTGEVLSGVLPLEVRFTPLKRLMKHARIITGEAKLIDAARKTVMVKEYHTNQVINLQYDQLVVGIGSNDNKESVKGLREFGYTVKEEGSLKEVQEQIIRLVEKYTSGVHQQNRMPMNIVIAGGGFAGVEVCGNICEYINYLKKYYAQLKSIPVNVYLVSSSAAILPEFGERFSKLVRYSQKCLNEYGVKMITNARLEHITNQGALLDTNVFINSEMVISTTGQTRSMFNEEAFFQYAGDHKIITNEFLQVKNHCYIWAGGDAAYVKRKNNKPSPANALWAIKHGELIGKNIVRKLKRKELKKFTFPGLGQAACVGMGKAMLELYGIPMTGWLAWWNRLLFFLYFMPTMQQRMKAILMFLHSWLFGRQLTTHNFYQEHKLTRLLKQNNQLQEQQLVNH